VQLIPDICRTGLVLGTSSQFVILLVYNFSSCMLGIEPSGLHSERRKTLDVGPGARTLIRHQSFGPLSPVLSTLVGNS